MSGNKWALIQSGVELSRCSSIKEAMDLVRDLCPKAEVKGNHVTDQIYEAVALSNGMKQYFTILWRLDQ